MTNNTNYQLNYKFDYKEQKAVADYLAKCLLNNSIPLIVNQNNELIFDLGYFRNGIRLRVKFPDKEKIDGIIYYEIEEHFIRFLVARSIKGEFSSSKLSSVKLPLIHPSLEEVIDLIDTYLILTMSSLSHEGLSFRQNHISSFNPFVISEDNDY